MKNSHAAVSSRKGFNYGVWVCIIVNVKRGKQESLNHYRIITNVADQNALQECPLNTQQCRFSGEAILAATSNTQLHQI